VKRAEAVESARAAGKRLNSLVRRASEKSLDDGHLVGLIGGDHSVPFGLIQVLAERVPGMGILHFDAHHDLRVAFEGFEWSHASIMHNVLEHTEVAKLVQVGIRDFAESERDRVWASDGRIVAHWDQEMRRAQFTGITFAEIARAVIKDLPRDVYVSLDVDGLDPKLCPNTGTPVPGGLDFAEVVFILSELVASGRRIVGFDLVEVSGSAEWDAIVGMRLLYKLIGFMVMSQDKRPDCP
jgi:agmatinase